ncbi:MAG: hypothetical protein IIV63_06915 [Clostridia bacterium]|nr:hypothetical protein [Clostridia bacterium]
MKFGLRYSSFMFVLLSFELAEGVLLLVLLLVFDDVADDVGLLDVLLEVVLFEVALLEVDSAFGFIISTTHEGVEGDLLHGPQRL